MIYNFSVVKFATRGVVYKRSGQCFGSCV